MVLAGSARAGNRDSQLVFLPVALFYLSGTAKSEVVQGISAATNQPVGLAFDVLLSRLHWANSGVENSTAAALGFADLGSPAGFITPVGVPVYHQRAFFNPNAPFDTKAPWTYREVEGRQIADFRHGVSFGHERNYTLEEFRLAA